MDHVDYLTSPEQVAEYVKKFRYGPLFFFYASQCGPLGEAW